MNEYLIFSTGLLLWGLIYLIMTGNRNLKLHAAVHSWAPETAWPPVTVIVPAAGVDPTMSASVHSLLDQDYPSFELLFVVRDMKDAATDIIRRETRGHAFVRLIFSGRAVACGQKNHNLLAGVREADPANSILVFCDCGHLARPDWLKCMVAPIVRKQAVLTTAYHHAVPEDHRLATIGRSATVLCMYLIQSISWLRQPWGGATAFSRSVFDDLGVAAFWADNVVDDISLANLLKKAGISSVLVPEAWLSTPVRDETLSSWTLWFVRQVFYLKVCMPGSWVLAGLICYQLAALMALAAANCIAGVLGLPPVMSIFSSLGFLVVLGGAGTCLRTLHPGPPAWWRWLPAIYTIPLIIAWSHIRTLFTLEICWRGITYKVTWKGRVTGIYGND